MRWQARVGETLVKSPFEGSDYFDVIMKVGSPYQAWSQGIAISALSL